MAGLKAFRAGVWNGEVIPAGDVAAMASNYALLSAGETPWYVPYVSINHDDGLSFGRVTRAAFDADDGTLVLDLDGVPAAVREWMQSDRLTAPSIEYWVPGTFAQPDGSFNTSPVLRCVTLLGNDAPGVKGLPPLSAAKFRDLGCVLKFADLPPSTRPGAKAMDERNQLIKAMSDMGMDTKTITDAVPTEAIKAMRDFAHKAMADVKKYQDEAAKKGGDKDGDEEVKKYRDRAAAAAKEVEGVLAQLRTQAETGAAAVAKQIAGIRDARIKAFRDEMVGPNEAKVAYMTPDQFDTVVAPLLATLDATTVRKFADGKTDGTALDEQIARVKAAHPTPIKKFGDRFADGRGTGQPPAMTPERRAELLGMTPEGRAKLAREKAAK